MTPVILFASAVLVVLLLSVAGLIRRRHQASEADQPAVTGSVLDWGSLLVYAGLLAAAGVLVGAVAMFLFDKLAGNVGMGIAVVMSIIGALAFLRLTAKPTP